MYFLDPATNWHILQKELRIWGFIVNTFKKDWPQAFTEMNKYIQDVIYYYFVFFSIITSIILFKI